MTLLYYPLLSSKSKVDEQVTLTYHDSRSAMAFALHANAASQKPHRANIASPQA